MVIVSRSSGRRIASQVLIAALFLFFSPTPGNGQVDERETQKLVSGLVKEMMQFLERENPGEEAVTVYQAPFELWGEPDKGAGHLRMVKPALTEALLHAGSEQGGAVRIELVDPGKALEVLGKEDFGLQRLFDRHFPVLEQREAKYLFAGSLYEYEQDVYLVAKLFRSAPPRLIWSRAVGFSARGRELIRTVLAHCVIPEACLLGGGGRETALWVANSSSTRKMAEVGERLVFDLVHVGLARSGGVVVVQGGQDAAKLKELLDKEIRAGVPIGGERIDERLASRHLMVLYGRPSGVGVKEEETHITLKFLRGTGSVCGIRLLRFRRPEPYHRVRTVFEGVREEEVIVRIQRSGQILHAGHLREATGERVYLVTPGFYTFSFFEDRQAFDQDRKFAVRSERIKDDRDWFVYKETEPWIHRFRLDRVPSCSEEELGWKGIGSKLAKAHCVLGEDDHDLCRQLLDGVTADLAARACGIDSLEPELRFLFRFTRGRLLLRSRPPNLNAAFANLESAYELVATNELSISRVFVREMKEALLEAAGALHRRDCGDGAPIAVDRKRCRRMGDYLELLK